MLPAVGGTCATCNTRAHNRFIMSANQPPSARFRKSIEEKMVQDLMSAAVMYLVGGVGDGLGSCLAAGTTTHRAVVDAEGRLGVVGVGVVVVGVGVGIGVVRGIRRGLEVDVEVADAPGGGGWGVGRLRREGRGAATQRHGGGQRGRHRGRGGGHSARMHVHLSVLWWGIETVDQGTGGGERLGRGYHSHWSSGGMGYSLGYKIPWWVQTVLDISVYTCVHTYYLRCI